MTRADLALEMRRLADESKAAGFHTEAAILYAVSGLTVIDRANVLLQGCLPTIQAELVSIESHMNWRPN